MPTNTYDQDQTVTTTGVLGTTTDIVTKTGSTPAGQLPTVTINADAVAGFVDIEATNGGVADATETLGVAGGYNIDANGGTVNVGTTGVSALASNGITIENGGTVNAGSTFLGVLNNSTITFGAGANTLNLDTTGTAVNLDIAGPITGFTAGDVINDENVAFTDVGSYSIASVGGNQVVTFYAGLAGAGGSLGSMTFAPGTFTSTGTNDVGSGPLQLTSGTGGALELFTCFLRGTHIATEQSEVRVEDLQIGDNIATLSNGKTVFKPVTWIGSRTVLASRLAMDEAFPVRIRAGAFTATTPQRDLLVTPEHCLFIEGKFIPARMLVNGGSIIIDRTISAYSYFHVELAAHAVILAEGLATESYLDTGNRGNFANAPVPSLQPDLAGQPTHAAWQSDAAAPLAVDRASVEPVWEMLRQRAALMGLLVAKSEMALTNDPDLHLVTESGLQIRPTLAEGNTYSFLVPGGTQSLRLVSRSARPTDVIGPYLDDRRRLGVLVGRIDLGIGRKRQAIDAHVAGPLAGWQAPETAAARWTDGDALLPIDLATLKGRPVFLDIELLQAGPYLAAADVAPEQITSVPFAVAA